MKAFWAFLIITTLGASEFDPYANHAMWPYPNVKNHLEKFGVHEKYDENSYTNLTSYLEERYTQDLSEDDDEDLFYINEIRGTILDQLHTDRDARAEKKERTFYKSFRMLYSLITSDAPDIHWDLKNMWKLRHNTKYGIPHIAIFNQNKKVNATKEATNLAYQTGRYFSREEIADKSYQRVSELDVDYDNFFWRTNQQIDYTTDAWKKLEDRVEEATTKKIQKKYEKWDGRYKLQEAQKYVFFDEFKNSSSGPKIKVKDFYKKKWKLKWGDEVYTENIVNRLYVALGGKMADLVYFNPMKDRETILILKDPEKQGSCTHVNSYSLFISCFMESRYTFNVLPYIKDFGVIDEEMIDRTKDFFKQTPYKKYRLKNFKRYTYIRFKESLMEYKYSNIYKTLGGVAMDDYYAKNDRAIRGMALLNMWLWNIDVKDDNNKGVLLPNGEYVEYQHDMGATLGYPGFFGNPNALKTGKLFVGARLNLQTFKPEAIFHQPVIFKSEAWKSATFADARWMAKKIVNVDRKLLEEILDHTNWPDFQREALIFKLLKRRNDIAKLYFLDMPKKVRRPTIKVSLKNKEDRQKAAERYGIAMEAIEAELDKHNALSGYTDTILSNGRIRKCKNSLVVNLLENSNHPSGLSTIRSRYFNDKPFEACKWQGPPKA